MRCTDYVDYAYSVSLGLSQELPQGLSLMCLSFLISLCVLGRYGECLLKYEGIMYIRYIPDIHNMHDLKYRHHTVPNMLWIHNTHKHDNIHKQHKSTFALHKLHIINIINIIIIIFIKNYAFLEERYFSQNPERFR